MSLTNYGLLHLVTLKPRVLLALIELSKLGQSFR